MEKETLENVRLQNVTLTLNPDDLKVFDAAVGKQNRSRNIRDLIRDYIAKLKRR